MDGELGVPGPSSLASFSVFFGAARRSGSRAALPKHEQLGSLGYNKPIYGLYTTGGVPSSNSTDQGRNKPSAPPSLPPSLAAQARSA